MTQLLERVSQKLLSKISILSGNIHTNFRPTAGKQITCGSDTTSIFSGTGAEAPMLTYLWTGTTGTGYFSTVNPAPAEWCTPEVAPAYKAPWEPTSPLKLLLFWITLHQYV